MLNGFISILVLKLLIQRQEYMNDILLKVIILVFVLCMIWIIIKHNKSIKQAKLNQLRDIKSHINSALSLYDCLYIHINMYKKRFTENKSLSIYSW